MISNSNSLANIIYNFIINVKVKVKKEMLNIVTIYNSEHGKEIEEYERKNFNRRGFQHKNKRNRRKEEKMGS